MYAAHRRSYSRSYIDSPAHNLWPVLFYTELDALDEPPPESIGNSERAPTAQSSSPWRIDPASGTAPVPATDPSPISALHNGREHIKARFRLLRRLPANHDNEGAEAPNPKSVDTAIAFIDSIKEPFPSCLATLDDDGSAVIEFQGKSKGFFADLTFRNDGNIECYQREPGRLSVFFEGSLNSPEARDFIKRYLCTVY